MSTTPLQGNQWYSGVSNTIVSPSLVSIAESASLISQTHYIDVVTAAFSATLGTVNLVIPGSVTNAVPAGLQAVLPSNIIITGIVLSADTTIVSGGAPTFAVNSNVVALYTTPASLANVNSKTFVTSALQSALPINVSQPLTLTVAVAAVTSGVLRARIYYL